MPVKSKLGMKINAAPTGNVEPEGMIAKARQRMVERGKALMGSRSGQMERTQGRVPKVAPPTIVAPSKRRRLV